MARLLFLATLLVSAAAFTAPRSAAVARPLMAEQQQSSPPKFEAFDAKTAGIQLAALAPVLAAVPANAFSAAYLPAILVPVMTLFLPAMGMALSFILVSKDEI